MQPTQNLTTIFRTLVIYQIVAAGLILSAASSANAESAARYMQRVANELIRAQRQGGEAAFARVIRSHADTRALGRYSLGNYSKRLRNEDREPYYSGMINFIARYAAKEAPNYPVAKAIVIGQTKPTKIGINVDSTVTLRSGTTYDVRWLIRRRGGTWKVRDAQVVGYWMSPFLRDLFEKYISDNGGNPRALVLALNR